MLNKIKIVKLSKELLSIAYRLKKYYWLKFKGLTAYKKLKKVKT